MRGQGSSYSKDIPYSFPDAVGIDYSPFMCYTGESWRKGCPHLAKGPLGTGNMYKLCVTLCRFILDQNPEHTSL